MNPEIKQKINKIDFELKSFFENVYIKDKFYKTGFFEITANKVSFIKESREHKRLEVKVIINQPDLLNDLVKWSYSTNPLNENALWIDRVSPFENISQDIIQIVEECRFDESYLMDLESLVDVINEDLSLVEDSPKVTVVDQYNKVFKKYAVGITMEQSEVHSVNENFISQASDRVVRFYHNSDIKISDMFKIESEVKSLENTNWVVFKEGYIEINFTPNF